MFYQIFFVPMVVYVDFDFPTTQVVSQVLFSSL